MVALPAAPGPVALPWRTLPFPTGFEGPLRGIASGGVPARSQLEPDPRGLVGERLGLGSGREYRHLDLDEE